MGQYHLGNTDGYNPVNPSLPKFLAGSATSVNDFQKLTRGIDRATISSGNGYQVRRYSNSTVIQQTQNVLGGKMRNFQIFGFVDKNNAGWVTTSIGTVNRIIPKIDSLYLDQLDSSGLPPKISVSANGYIVIEAVYDPVKPFPSTAILTFVSTLDTNQMNPSYSQYPLASVKYTPANAGAKTPADVSVTQIHESGNLSVARVKVGSSKVYWQWWRV